MYESLSPYWFVYFVYVTSFVCLLGYGWIYSLRLRRLLRFLQKQGDE